MTRSLLRRGSRADHAGSGEGNVLAWCFPGRHPRADPPGIQARFAGAMNSCSSICETRPRARRVECGGRGNVAVARPSPGPFQWEPRILLHLGRSSEARPCAGGLLCRSGGPSRGRSLITLPSRPHGGAGPVHEPASTAASFDGTRFLWFPSWNPEVELMPIRIRAGEVPDAGW